MRLVEILNLAQVPSILIMGAMYVAYVLIGGVVFWKLEGNLGREDVSAILARKQQVLKTYECLNSDGIDAVIQTLRARYGNISPKTTAGQIFCVFFAVIGIPLNMVVLNRVGKYMLVIERNICSFLQGKTRHPRCTRFFIHLISYLTGIVLFFVVPMIMFQGQEGWTYAQAIYYCFITLSTIGFGDYVADSNPDQYYPDWYSFLMASWIFFGLAWLALVINHSIDILERLNGAFTGWWHRRHDMKDKELEGDRPESENPDCAESDNTQVEQVEAEPVKQPPPE
ncbi:hypothetical protein CRUP_024375 [Coryphaenoides rupestris]|nr:hypothetical protein CRUP_024375 [Coryphaenoides rupestris]